MKSFDEYAAECPLVAILRGVETTEIEAVCDALYEGGIRLLEITLNTPNALACIDLAVKHAGGRQLVGAGTVLTPEEVNQVAAHGGKFIISPNTDRSVIVRTKELGLLSMPGFLTPSEAFIAIAAGAEHAWRQLGLEPVFLSINHRSDGRAADRVAARLGQAPVHILREPLDHAGAIGLMSRMEAVVSMRLHGLIFALGAAAPSVGISYDPKVTAFLDYIGCPLHAPLEELTAEGLCGLIDRAVAMADDREGLRRTAARLREMCAVNARCAAQLLRQD